MPSSLSILAALATTSFAAAAFCPPIDSRGHAADQQWTLSNLNWKLTRRTTGTWPPPESDMDEASVTFALDSSFNAGNSPITCFARGVEFSEEYTRQLAGKTPTYHWYNCTGGSDDVLTEFRMVWWNTHDVEVRQHWKCPEANMRATGTTSVTSVIKCEFAEGEAYRTSCVSSTSKPLTASLVKVLDPPVCAGTQPSWHVSNWIWVSGWTPAGFPYSLPQQNMTFDLEADHLAGYTVDCTQAQLVDSPGGVFHYPFKCARFEAEEQDVPPTAYQWEADKLRLTVNQTFTCGGKKTTAIGEVDLKDGVQIECSERDVQREGFVDHVKTCVGDFDVELQ